MSAANDALSVEPGCTKCALGKTDKWIEYDWLVSWRKFKYRLTVLKMMRRVCVCVCDGQTEQKSADGIGPDWPVMIQLP